MKELYLDLTTGAAGDMISAALLELFDDRGAALARLNAIGVPGVEYAALPVTRSGVTGTRLEVRYHGEEEGSEPAHHASRGLADVTEIVSKLNLPDEVRKAVLDVYRTIADAESAVHGEPANQIHFHELGMMDAIADISAAALLVHLLHGPVRARAAPRPRSGNCKAAGGSQLLCRGNRGRAVHAHRGGARAALCAGVRAPAADDRAALRRRHGEKGIFTAFRRTGPARRNGGSHP